jgi:hypothetical protein
MQKIDICNVALMRLGQPPLLSESDDTPDARRVFSQFDAALEVVLRAYPWPFAIKRKALSPLVEKPPFGYSFYYPMPPDLIRLVDVFPKNVEYAIEYTNTTQTGTINVFATNSQEFKIRYVSKEIIASALDSQVAQCVALELAGRLAIVVTENQQLRDMLHSEYMMALANARNTWAVEDYPREVQEGNWITAHEFGHHSSLDYFTQAWNPWGPDGTGVSGA